MEILDKLRESVAEVVNKDAIEGVIGMGIGFTTSNLVANEADKFAVTGLPFGLTGGYASSYTPSGSTITIADLYPSGGLVHASAVLQNIPDEFREPTTDGTIKITANGMKYAKFIMTVPEVTADDGLLETHRTGRFVWRSASRIVSAVGLRALSGLDAVYDVNVIDLESTLQTAAATSVGLVLVDGMGTFIPGLRSLSNINVNQVSEANLDTPVTTIAASRVHSTAIPNASRAVPQIVNAPRSRNEEVIKLM